MNFQEEFVLDVTNPKFQISNYGRALYIPTKSIIEPVLLPPNRCSIPMCWAMVNNADYICIPRSVGMNFLKGQPGYGELIIHLDRDPMNNKTDNLKWARRIADISNSNDIPIIYIHNICLMLEKGYSSPQIIDALGLNRSRESMINLINSIKRGISYPGVSAQYNFTKAYSNRIYTTEEKHKICKLIQQGVPASQIAQILQISNIVSLQTIVSAVKHKKQWNSISDMYF